MSKSLAGRPSKPTSIDAAPASSSVDADAPHGGVRVHASLPTSPPRSALAAALSVVFHLILILLAIRLTQAVVINKDNPAGNAIMKFIGGGGGGGGAGGAVLTALTKPPPPPAVTPEVPPPVPEVEPVPAKVPQPVETPSQTVPSPSASAVSGAGSGGGSGGGIGTGAGPGRGSGIGPGSGSGTGGGAGGGRGGFDPINKQMIVPPMDGIPKELRGKEFEVTFFVTVTGLVSDVKVNPPITNRGFAKKFDEIMRGYTFMPARDAAGNKVPGVVTFRITIGSQ